MRLLGERACTRLLERIADPTLPYRVDLLPTELVVRESCGCAAADPELATIPAQAHRHEAGF
jgi:hypothetical protein